MTVLSASCELPNKDCECVRNLRWKGKAAVVGRTGSAQPALPETRCRVWRGMRERCASVRDLALLVSHCRSSTTRRDSICFGPVDAVLLRPLPVSHPDHLYRVGDIAFENVANRSYRRAQGEDQRFQGLHAQPHATCHSLNFRLARHTPEMSLDKTPPSHFRRSQAARSAQGACLLEIS